MRTWIAATCEEHGAGSAERRIVFSYVFDWRSLPLKAGFTLIELSLVLFIIGLLVTVALPRFGGIQRARLETSARRLAALVRYIGGEAAFKSHLYRLHYDLDAHTYWVSVLAGAAGKAEFINDPDPLTQLVELPATITFADVRVPGIGQVSRGQVYTYFYPQGYTDPTVIHLRDTDARIMTISIPPLTGEVGVYEGHVNGFANGFIDTGQKAY